jgi:predicted O-methyltransferase YrrM
LRPELDQSHDSLNLESQARSGPTFGTRSKTQERNQMMRDTPLHNFLIEFDETGFFDGVEGSYTPRIDVCVILTLLRRYKPRTFLEIGTNQGYTSLAIKKKFSKLAITTIDPGDKVPGGDRPPIQNGEYLSQDEIGSVLKPYPDVTIIKERFEDVDFKDSKFDCIYIDGNHSYAEVIKDTERALNLIAPGGVIIWHDVNNAKEVTDALSAFRNLEIITPQHTWIGFCKMP